MQGKLPFSKAAMYKRDADKRHKQEVFWQIIFPLLVGCLLILAVAIGVVWSGIAGKGALAQWADISIIWLIVPAMITGLIFLALLAALAYLVTWLLKNTSRFTWRLLDGLLNFQNQVTRLMDASVGPIFRLRSWAAGWNVLRRVVRRER